MCFHICPGSSKNKFYTSLTWLQLPLYKMCKIHLYVTFSSYLKNAFQNVSKTKTRVMASFYIAQALNPYLDHTFWKCIIVQIIGNTFCSIIGIILPLIKVQIKLFKNPKPMVCWACKFHKFSSNTNFTYFWIYLGP